MHHRDVLSVSSGSFSSSGWSVDTFVIVSEGCFVIVTPRKFGCWMGYGEEDQIRTNKMFTRNVAATCRHNGFLRSRGLLYNSQPASVDHASDLIDELLGLTRSVRTCAMYSNF